MCTTSRLIVHSILRRCGVQDVSDMYTHLLRNRIIFVGQRINDEVFIFKETISSNIGSLSLCPDTYTKPARR